MREDAIDAMKKAEAGYDRIKAATDEVLAHMRGADKRESCHDFACQPLKSCTCGKHGCNSCTH